MVRSRAGSRPGPDEILHPGTLGDAIFLMLACHELTGDAKYLREADRFADLANDSFLKDGVPLPPATTRHPHYDAITRADTLMMALLKLRLAHQPAEGKVSLVYTDR